MLSRFVAIDLETTGLDPAGGRIIEFGAVRVEDGKVVARFAKLCNPGVEIPPEVERLTGISNADLARGEPVEQVAGEFLAFLDGLPVVAHNASFDEAFLLAEAGGRFSNDVYDTLELARVLLPTLPRHDLTTLVKYLELPQLTSHRAADDAEMTAGAFLALQKMLDALPLAVLREINWLLGGDKSTLARLFADAGRRRLVQGFSGGGEGEPIAEAFKDFSKLHVKRAPKQEELSERKPLDSAEIERMFDESGLFGKSMPGYERRAEQIEMVRRVCAAFNDSKHLMIEAGTGTGKSMAYLVPAVAWAALNKRKVVISTNTKNLQEQLFHKDLPFLESVLPVRFKRAILKGRANYLCIRNFLRTLRNKDTELNADERRALLPVVVWAVQTETGDISENTAYFTGGASVALADRIHGLGDECLGRACRHFKKCFLWKARMEALAADVIVANHAVVFADVASDNKILPPYSDIVFDEAHNIENVATEYLGMNVNRLAIVRVLGRLYRRTGRKKGGYLAGVEKFTEDPDICQAADRAMDQCSYVVKATDEFLAEVELLFPAGRSDKGDTLTIGADKIRGGALKREGASDRVISAISSLVKSLEEMTEVMRDMKEFRKEAGREIIHDIGAQALFLREIIGEIDFIVRGDEENFVFWIERTPPSGRRLTGFVSLHCAPVRIAPILKEQLYDKKECMIFSSATLTVGGDFGFFKSRLGLDLLPEGGVSYADVGSPFDYEKQAFVTVADFLPEPTREEDGGYAKELSGFLGPLFTATQGRAMALFTSYRLLDAVYHGLRGAMEREGILLLCQGRSGSRASITRAFQSGEKSVLLGTSSFWEGVDIAGDSLRCLVITRLPFQVFTDPVFQARYEDVEKRGEDAFAAFSVPNAVIRFRQGFGRLIRSKRDSGVVVIADKRIVTKRYGGKFAKSLPAPCKKFTRKDEMIDAVRLFLARP